MQMLEGTCLHKEKEKKKYFLQVTSENVLQIHLQAFIYMNDIGKHSHLHIHPPLRLSFKKLECLVPKGKTETLIDYDLWC